MEKIYTSEDLSYIAFVARGCLYNHFKPWYQEQAITFALDLFKKRVSRIDCNSNYVLFKATESLQLKLSTRNFDADKYWLLLLFLYDYTESCFGEYPVFDSYSVADRLGTMIALLDSGQKCKLTISNQEESIDLDAKYIKKDLKTLLLKLLGTPKFHYFPFVGKEENKVTWHKIKFFMKMLDYFIQNFQQDQLQNKRKRKDWLLYSQSLYLVGYLNDIKYLNGYTLTKRKIKKLDKPDKTIEQKTPLKDLGKFFTDNTKNIKDTAIRSKSKYHRL